MEIGQRIKWTIGNITREGLFIDNEGDKSNVMCIKAGDVPMAIQCKVDKNIIEIIS